MVNALLQCHTVSAEYQGQTSLVTLAVSLLVLLSVPKCARQCLAGLPIDYHYLYLAGSYVQFGLPVTIRRLPKCRQQFRCKQLGSTSSSSHFYPPPLAVDAMLTFSQHASSSLKTILLLKAAIHIDSLLTTSCYEDYARHPQPPCHN